MKEDKFDFYIDKKSVRKVGKFHYFWMMADYIRLEQDDDPNIRSNITFNILNCKTNEFKMVTHTSFTLNKAKGRIDMDEIIPDFDISYFDWQYFNEDTSFGMVFKKVCKLFPKKYQFLNKKVSFNLMLSNNKSIKKLNKIFRNKNKSTDVLSFPSKKKIKISKNTFLGDVIISYNYLDKPKSQELKMFKEKAVKIFTR